MPSTSTAKTAPTMTRAIAAASVTARVWFRIRKPAVAARAGSRLMRIAKVEAGRRRRASSSRVYGRTDERTATAEPRATVVGSRSFAPAPTTPNGRNASAATPMARASPSACGKRRPVRALKTMYAPHMAPAPRAKAMPTGSRLPKPPPPRRKTPASASEAHSALIARREARTESVRGPSTSRVTAGPRGMRSTAW
ncbi:hypothetical protein SALBM311S_11178 [Streptomyces alboniger]